MAGKQELPPLHVRHVSAVPDPLNREIVIITYEDPEGDLHTEHMHPVDATEFLKTVNDRELDDIFHSLSPEAQRDVAASDEE